MNSRKRILFSATMLLVTSLFSFSTGNIAFAKNDDDQRSAVSKEKFYFDYAENAGDDDGFYNTKSIVQGDVHNGWRLGRFVISGYTRVIDNPPDYPVFLKNVGDEITLSFILEQNIDALNGDSKLTINDDIGYDDYFDIPETHFGRGAFIIAHRDYQNNFNTPQLYTDFLIGKQKGAETTVELCEEGDYEFALDYSLLHKTFDDLWVIPTSKVATFEDDYQISGGFSVRNGNCMVYPMDVKTDNELTNKAFTPNGFYLDLARSRYLDIDITKEIYTEGAAGLTEDIRFNQPARDGEEFTEEGVYTISVKNNYTNRRTEKVIYVGNNDILKAYVSNAGYSIREITNLVNEGATIKPDGSIKMPETTTTAATTTTDTSTFTTATSSLVTTIVLETTALQSTNQEPNDHYIKKDEAGKESTNNNGMTIPIVAGALGGAMVASITTTLILTKRRKSGDTK